LLGRKVKSVKSWTRECCERVLYVMEVYKTLPPDAAVALVAKKLCFNDKYRATFVHTTAALSTTSDAVFAGLCLDIREHMYACWLPVLFGKTKPLLSDTRAVFFGKRGLSIHIPLTPYESVTDPLLVKLETLYGTLLEKGVVHVRVAA